MSPARPQPGHTSTSLCARPTALSVRPTALSVPSPRPSCCSWVSRRRKLLLPLWRPRPRPPVPGDCAVGVTSLNLGVPGQWERSTGTPQPMCARREVPRPRPPPDPPVPSPAPAAAAPRRSRWPSRDSRLSAMSPRLTSEGLERRDTPHGSPFPSRPPRTYPAGPGAGGLPGAPLPPPQPFPSPSPSPLGGGNQGGLPGAGAWSRKRDQHVQSPGKRQDGAPGTPESRRL